MRLRNFVCLASAMAVVLLSGCISLKVGTEASSSSLKINGLANGYATFSALHPYNGTILDFGLLSEASRKGEILSLDIWPLAGVGVGVVGARVRVLPLEVGLGLLWYDPHPTAVEMKVNRVQGSGVLAAEDRPVSGFNAVRFSGAGELNITQGDQEALSIEADDNLLPLIKTEVRDGTLVIGPKDEGRSEFSSSRPIRINLAVKKLEKITLSGAAAVKAAALSADKLEIKTNGSGKIAIEALTVKSLNATISGSGEFNLAGRADAQTIHISGSGKYRAGKLESQSVKLSISGSGDAVVWTRENLDLKISGSGRVDYYGQPRVTQEVSGSGRVKSLGQPE